MKVKNDIVIALSIFGTFVLVAFMLALHDKPQVDNGRVMRQEEEIISDDVVYLDEESIALNGSPVDTELRNMALSAYDQINAIRLQNGLNELMWDGNLESVANVRAKELPKSFSHTRPNGKPWYTVNSKIQGGENLAYGFATATDVVDAWMNSPSHKDNILYGEFKTMAISVYEINDCYYWVQAFGY